MPVLNRLLKRKPEPESLDSRISALDKLPVEELAAIAGHEEQSAEMRMAAIDRLPYGEVLARLAFEGAASRIQRTARRRIARLIDAEQLAFERFRADVSDVFAVLAVVGLSAQAELLEQFLDSLEDQRLLCRLAVEGEPVALRQMAAERVHDPDALHRLLKDAKGRDKTVFRIARRKVDAIKEKDRKLAEARSRIEGLCSGAERHARRPFDERFADRTADLERQWRELERHAPAEAEKRFAEALAQCRGKIEEQERIAREQAERRKALDEEAAARRRLQGELRALIASLYTAGEADETRETAVRDTLAQSRKAWEQTQVHGPAEPAETKQFERLCADAGFVLGQLAEHGPLQAHVEALEGTDAAAAEKHRTLKARLKPARTLGEDEIPAPVKAAFAAVDEWQQVRRQKKEDEQKRIRSVGGLLRKASRVVEQGHMRQAFGMRKAIEGKLEQIDRLPASLARQLETLDESLDKLQDWRDYAVLPKKEELVEQMEALVGADTAPEALAKQIKALQEQWRDVSKGGQDEHPELWERFHEASQKAYVPCQEYFEKRADLRKQNLEKRRQLVAQLDEYYRSCNWEDPDWKAVEKVVQTAVADWRKCSPTNRAETRPVQDEFDALLGRIREHLDREYGKNIGVKQALIQRAEKLAAQEDVRQAAEEIKRLQAQWTQAGITPRREDRKLWKAFRKHCDAVFGKLSEESAAFKAGLEESRQKAEALCAEAEQLGKRTGSELLEARAELDRLRGEFNAIDTLPRGPEKAIRGRFRRAVDTFEAKVKKERNAARAREWDNLLAAADAVRAYELALLDNAGADEALKAVEELTAAGERWPSGAKQAIDRRLENVRSISPGDLEKNEAALRTLCIRAEILTGIESPPEDKERRMQYQLERLQGGLGRAARHNDETIEALTLEWVETGAVRAEVYNALLERLNACRRKAG